jgi:hypothetical protein
MKHFTRSSINASRSPEHSSWPGQAAGKCSCGESCAKCKEPANTSHSPQAAEFGHSFGKVGVFADDRAPLAVQDQTPTQSGGLGEDLMSDIPQSSIMEPTTTLETESSIPKGSPVIDSVDLIDSSTGAVGGFPAISCDASLDHPGPYNDHWWKGSVANVQQVHFHLSQGWPGDVRVNRQINRTASTAKKQNDPKVGWDGPPEHEILTTKDKLVVADAPGFCSRASEDDFPVTYSADFSLYAFDPLDMKVLASISYHVEISKTSFYQIDPVNTIKVTGTKIGSGVKSPVPPKQK